MARQRMKRPWRSTVWSVWRAFTNSCRDPRRYTSTGPEPTQTLHSLDKSRSCTRRIGGRRDLNAYVGGEEKPPQKHGAMLRARADAGLRAVVGQRSAPHEAACPHPFLLTAVLKDITCQRLSWRGIEIRSASQKQANACTGIFQTRKAQLAPAKHMGLIEHHPRFAEILKKKFASLCLPTTK